MEKKLIYILLLCCCLGIISCSNSECYSLSSKKSTVYNYFDSCKSITVSTPCYVYVMNDTSNYVEISGSSSILQNTQVSESQGSIQIKNLNTCHCLPSNNKPKIIIHTTNDIVIFANEACSISTLHPFTNNISIDIQSLMIDVSLELSNSYTSISTQAKTGGNIRLTGKSKKCNLSAFYTTSIQIDDYEVNTLYITNGTNKDVTVFATDSLITKNTRTGNIYYKGNPYYTNFQKPQKNIQLD